MALSARVLIRVYKVYFADGQAGVFAAGYADVLVFGLG